MGLMDKAGEFLNSEQGEQLSDQAIQAGSDAANRATGNKYADQIAQGGQFADDRIGAPGAQPTGTPGDVPPQEGQAPTMTEGQPPSE